MHLQSLLSPLPSDLSLFRHRHRSSSIPSSSLPLLHHSTRLSSRSTTTSHLLAAVAPPPSPLEDATSGEGPVELPPSSSSIFATSDQPSPLQVSISLLLTGAISFFLFRSLRRRAKRAKEMRFRSSGVKDTESLIVEALESSKALGTSLDPKAPPSPVQAFLGALAAAAVALILYKFTTTVEASLNRQSISDNYSVRQLTITVRTIVNGLCYLATFVFGVNSFGLLLYSVQLAFNSLLGTDSTNSSSEQETVPHSDAPFSAGDITSEDDVDNSNNMQE